MHPDGHASRFGGTGEKQYGIDVLVDGAKTATYQCKRHQQFGPGDVKNAVGAVQLTAPENYLFLSRTTASAAARKEMLNHPSWELWDGEDIGRLIRTQMPRETALRLVDSYFPNWREPFLGIAQPGPWLTAAEFFSPICGDQIYTQEWTLVGRAKELDSVVANIGTPPHVSLLIGRGGIGKTRLLRSAAEKLANDGHQVRLLQTASSLRPEDFELLPHDGKLVLIVDDAHDRSDIAELLAGLRRRNPPAALLLAMRPYGDTALAQDLRRVGVRAPDLPATQLEDLKLSDAEALAREALGGGPEAFVRRLAVVTLDSPLATVVGGSLIRRNLLDPARLEQSDEIRNEILSGFSGALVADPSFEDTELRQAVLDVVAALQPVRTADEPFQQTIVKLLGAPFDRVQRHLRSFEDAGVLLRRGMSLRIVPDLLGDVILARAAFDEHSGTSTGFLKRAFDACEGDSAAHLFVNASRVDWQVRQQRDESISLVDGLWEALQADTEKADLWGLLAILKLLRRVAYFQPKRALDLLRWIIRHPTPEVGTTDSALLDLYPPSFAQVLHAMPALLQAIAHNMDWMHEACDLLWQLAQVDDRPTNPNSEHPIRVLRDLAEYDPAKPLAYNIAILDIASRWFEPGQAVSPFEVLDPLLATEGSSQSYNAYTLTFRPYAINAETVEPVRQRVVEMAFDEIRLPDVGRAAAGVRAIESSLHYPRGTFGRVVPEDERNRWTPGMLATIEELGLLLQDPDVDPAIAVAIMRPLHSNAEYGATEEARRAGEEALMKLPDTLPFRLALCLHDGWGQLLRERDMSFEESDALRQARVRAVASDLLRMGDDRAVVQLLEERLDAESRAFGKDAGHPGPMVAALVEARAPIGHAILERVVAAPECKLTPLLPVVLARLAEQSSSAIVSAAEALLALEAPVISRSVAQAFGWNRGSRSSLVEGELSLLKAFATDADPAIRNCVVWAAQRIAEATPQIGIDLLASVPFRDAPQLSDEIFQALSNQRPMSWRQLSIRQRDAMLDQLVVVDDVSSFWVVSFLSRLSQDDPRCVLRLCQARIEKAETMDYLGQYRPLPYHWDTALRVREHGEFTAVLREIRDWIGAGSDDGWVRREIGAELFRAVAGIFDEPVLAVLSDGLESTSERAVAAVAWILRKAPRALVLGNPDFVVEALDSAARFGDQLEQQMRGALWAAVVTGSRMGTPGQPFPEDVEQYERSKDVAAKLPSGSPGSQFYAALSKSAEETIRKQVEADKPYNDRRAW